MVLSSFLCKAYLNYFCNSETRKKNEINDVLSFQESQYLKELEILNKQLLSESKKSKKVALENEIKAIETDCNKIQNLMSQTPMRVQFETLLEDSFKDYNLKPKAFSNVFDTDVYGGIDAYEVIDQNLQSLVRIQASQSPSLANPYLFCDNSYKQLEVLVKDIGLEKPIEKFAKAYQDFSNKSVRIANCFF